MKNEKTHYRDGAVVLYKRERSNKWQARIKIGKGKGSWKRIATGESTVSKAADIACEKYDEHKYRVKLGPAPDSKSFRIVGKMAVKELQDGSNKNVRYDLTSNGQIPKEIKTFLKGWHKHVKIYDNKIKPRWGGNTVQMLPRAGIAKPWRMAQDRKSPAYTTSWKELPVVRASGQPAAAT